MCNSIIRRNVKSGSGSSSPILQQEISLDGSRLATLYNTLLEEYFHVFFLMVTYIQSSVL